VGDVRLGTVRHPFWPNARRHWPTATDAGAGRVEWHEDPGSSVWGSCCHLDDTLRDIASPSPRISTPPPAPRPATVIYPQTPSTLRSPSASHRRLPARVRSNQGPPGLPPSDCTRPYRWYVGAFCGLQLMDGVHHRCFSVEAPPHRRYGGAQGCWEVRGCRS